MLILCNTIPLWIIIADDSLISGPLSLKSYYTVADYMDKKTKFSFKEGATVQVIQKDSTGKLCKVLTTQIVQ